VPTWTAFAVSQLLEAHLPDLVNYQFTAEMEDELDAISRGEMGHLEYLKNFYFGNGHPGLKQQLEDKVSQIDARAVCRILIGKPPGRGKKAAEVYVRVGRYGPFVEQGDRRASLPENTPPDELTLQAALQMLDKAAADDEPLGICPDTHKPVYLKVGRYGPYVQRGTLEDDDKPQNASLLRGMEPQDVDIQLALKLLALPRTLGDHPQTGLAVTAQNGRFGPYVKSGDETRSLPDELSPLEVTLQQALDLLAQPRPSGRGYRAARARAVKLFDTSPVTGEPVRLTEGRYGPYVTDGQTNAALPRGTTLEEVSFDYALELLRARAEKGPLRKRARRRTTKKKATRKKKRPAKKK